VARHPLREGWAGGVYTGSPASFISDWVMNSMRVNWKPSPGAMIILPGNTPHFHRAKSSEYMTQVTAIGPLGLEYLRAKDDPRNNNS